jgi:hypothetical protein
VKLGLKHHQSGASMDPDPDEAEAEPIIKKTKNNKKNPSKAREKGASKYTYEHITMYFAA